MKNMPVFFRPTFFYLLIASSFLLSLIQLENYDIWWHLRTGQWIIDNLAVPRTQLFSYSIDGTPWVSHSWFFQVLIFYIYKFLGGVNSLILFRAIIVSFILWITLKGFLKKVYFPVFLLIGWLFSGLFLARIPIRPELISTTFLALYLYVLFNKKNLWWFVFIQCFWVNMHGYSILGPILLALFILCEFIKRKIKLPFDWNKVRYFNDKAICNKSLVILAIIACLFLFNPYGIGNLRYPLFAIKGFFQSVNNFYHVSELSPLSLSDILFSQKNLLLTGAVALFMVSLLWNIQRVNLFNILIYGVFFLMYYAANRHNGFFAVVACFCVLENFKVGAPSYLKKYFKSRYRGVLLIILSVLLGSYIVYYQFSKVRELNKGYVYSKDLSFKNHIFGIDKSIYPKKAVDFILENNIKGPIFNGFNISGYLIWRLYPSYKVFIDGRTEVYGRRFMDEFAHGIIDFKKWRQLDKRYGFNMVILDYSSTDLYYYLIKNLYESDKWRLVYFGDVAVVFVKDALANEEVISLNNILFKDVKDYWRSEDYLIGNRDEQLYPEYFLNKARFFIKAVDMPELALKDLEKARLINPESYEVYQLLGYTYFKMKRFKEAEGAFMQSLEIDPSIAEPYLNLGSVAAEMGLYKKAYFLYKQVLRLDKNNKVALDNLSKLSRQNLDRAIR